jgi:hypothetical protein
MDKVHIKDEKEQTSSCDKSEYSVESEMGNMSESNENQNTEQSYVSAIDYPDSLNSSSAYCDSFTFWSPASSVSTDRQWSPTSSVSTDRQWSPTSSVSTDRQWSPISNNSEHEAEETSIVSSELETFPVYTQDGPTHLYPQHSDFNSPSPSDVSPGPLDLSVKKDLEQSLSDTCVEHNIENTGDMIDYYEPICVSEPCVATLEQNHSTVWKEIDIGGVSYSYTPSVESTQYATDCFNNAVYGAPNFPSWSGDESFYIATALHQQEIIESRNDVPEIPGITVPLQNFPIVATSDQGVTFPLYDTRHSQTLKEQPFTYSQTCFPNENEMEGSKSDCYYGDRYGSSVGRSVDGYESSGNSADGSSDSDNENNLIRMMDISVKDKLKKKAGDRFISPDAASFELIDSLKDVKPYVISGWISSTYLMALAKKSDLVNDMFDNALNNKGEIHDWIVENCRKTTPAVLARDLLFRLFTLEELNDLNLIALARKQRFKAIKKCVEKQFSMKVTKKVWSKCVGLIKSSVSTLFKHRVKQVQNFFTMHGAFE